MSSPKRGNLFLNSKTDSPLHPSSVSKLLCSLINEADPVDFLRATMFGESSPPLPGPEVWTLARLPSVPFGSPLIYIYIFFFIDIYLIVVMLLEWLLTPGRV